MVWAESSAVEIPPAVTSALAYPSVPAGLICQRCRLLFGLKECCVAPPGRRVKCGPPVCKTLGEEGAQRGSQGSGIAAAWLCSQRSGAVLSGREVDGDGPARLPIGGDLKDGGPAEPAMGEEHLLAKARLSLGGDDLGREAGEVRVTRAVFRLPDERNQRGAAGLDREPELCSDAICEIGSAHLWNGETAGCDDQSASAVVCRRGVN